MAWQRSIFVAFAVFAGSLLTARAPAAITFPVTVDDPLGEFTPIRSSLIAHAQAAGNDWARHFVGNASLEIVVRVDRSHPRGGGRSTTTAFVRNNGTYNIFEPAAIAELRNGVDRNGATADIEITLHPDYVFNELWLDPAPTQRTEVVPNNRTDAMSVFLHELGHAFGFNGWADYTTAVLPGNFASPFDELVVPQGTAFAFSGAAASSLYGGPVPLTFGNLFHVGNRAPLLGESLIPDLMNGVVFNRGARYNISPLDLAFLDDMGVPLSTATPGDANGDGVVTRTDVAILAQHFGQSTTLGATDGDFTGNGLVALADLHIVQSNLAPGGPSPVPVPEPATWLLALAAAPLFRRFPHRPNHRPDSMILTEKTRSTKRWSPP